MRYVLLIILTIHSVDGWSETKKNCIQHPYVENVCLENEKDIDLVQAVSSGTKCDNDSYINPIGTTFCVAKEKLALSIVKRKFHIEKIAYPNCKQGFSAWEEYQLCVSDTIGLALKQEKLVLTMLSKGARLGKNGCPIGYIKPLGFSLCVQNSIIFGEIDIERHHSRQSDDLCRRDPHRLMRNGFCIPKNISLVCGSTLFPCEEKPGDRIRVIPGGYSCCGNIDNAIESGMPLYNPQKQELGLMPTIACSPPAAPSPFYGYPAEGRHLEQMCIDPDRVGATDFKIEWP